MIDLTWTPAENNGKIPSVRTRHAAFSQGDVLVIWGGEDARSYKNDMFIYNFITSTWHEIIAKNQAPSPRIGACAALNFPKFFIFGGKTYSEISNEAWEYDFNSNIYTQLASSDFYYYCCRCQILNERIYLTGAIDKEFNGFSYIPYYIIQTNTWGRKFNRLYSAQLVENISQIFPDYLIEYGGQKKDVAGSSLIYLYNEIDNISPLNIVERQAFACGYIYLNSKLIFYGGGSLDLLLTPSRYLAANRFYSINLDILTLVIDVKLYCSQGSYLSQNEKCEFCPKGTYSDELGLSECKKCPEGTFNSKIGSNSKRQCYPCHEGYFNNKAGAIQCLKCESKSYCPIGSIASTFEKPIYKEKSTQPNAFQISKSLQEIPIFFIYSTSFAFSIIILILFLSPKLKRLIKKIDMFTDKHNNAIDQPLILKQTLIGAFFTIVFIAISCIIFGTAYIQYMMINIIETKSLQPISVFDKEVVNFTADFNITVKLYYYGGKCENISDSKLTVTTTNYIEGQIELKAEKVNTNCLISYFCTDCKIDSELKLTFKSNEEMCYSKVISVEISSVSSIPDSLSVINKTIESDTNKVFIGSTASIFSYSFTPSAFYSYVDKYISSQTGYHLSEYSPPSKGSSYTIDELAEVYGLLVEVNLDKRNFGLFTERSLKQSAFLAVSAVFGSVSGIFSLISFAMFVVEALVKVTLKKIESAKRINELLIRRQCLEVFTIQYDHYGISIPKLTYL